MNTKKPATQGGLKVNLTKVLRAAACEVRMNDTTESNGNGNNNGAADSSELDLRGRG